MQELDIMIDEFNNDKSLDYLYNLCDEWMVSNQFDKLNNLFNEDKKCPIVVMLGLLTATAPVKSKLPSRKLFIEKNRGELTDKLISGLE